MVAGGCRGGRRVDYLAFGAMCPSPTKARRGIGPARLLTRAKREFLAVAAIGGITLDNARPLIDAGASLLAVISDVFSAPRPGRPLRPYAGAVRSTPSGILQSPKKSEELFARARPPSPAVTAGPCRFRSVGGTPRFT